MARELTLLRGRAARGSQRARISLNDLAARVRLPRSTVHAYVSGKHLVPADVLDRIVIALGASAAEQRGWSDAWFRLAACRHVPQHSPGPPPARPRQLPCDVDGFTGRLRELAELDRIAATPDSRLVVVAGTGGVGKTALAVRWAHQVADRFPDGQLWIDLRGFDPDLPVRAPDALAGFLRALGVDGAAIPHEPAERAALYRSLLHRRRMLVLLDNARDSEHVRPLLPGTPSCLTLVTSRDSAGGLVARHGARRLELEPLPPTDAVALLRRLAGDPTGTDRSADDSADDSAVRGADSADGGADSADGGAVDAEFDEAAAALAERCARLPLALRVAAERLGISPGMTIRDLADELANRQRRLTMLDAGDDPRAAVRRVLLWSYHRLPAVTASVFRLVGLHPGGDLGEQAAAALCGSDLASIRRQLDLLARAHLVEQVSPGRYAMHDLLKALAVELTVAEPAVARRALSRLSGFSVHAVATATDLLYPADRHRRPMVPLPTEPTEPAAFPDATAARDWLDRELANLMALAHRIAHDDVTADLPRLSALLWRHLDVGCRHGEAAQLHGLALAAAERAADPAGQAVALNNLGVLHWRLGRHVQALEHLRRALARYREAGDGAGECRALNNLGAVHWQLGEAEPAQRYTQLALEVAGSIGEATTQAVAVYNLGVMHWLHGRHDRAAECCRQALDRYRALGDRIGEASAVAGLGIIAARLGEYDEAETRFRVALEIACQLNGRGVEARVRGHLGALCERTGRHPEAVEHHLRALALQLQVRDLVGQADSLAGLAVACLGVGQVSEALEHSRQAIALSRRIDHRYGLATGFSSLGEATLAAEDPATAAAAFRTAGGHAANLGDRYEQARALDGLGRALSALGETAEAATTWRRAAHLFRELGVPDAARAEARLDAAERAATM